jgi:RHS repeat-associated protein
MGRRVQKQVFDWDLNDPNDGEDDAWATTPATHRKFLWYNWLMIAELDGSDDSRVRTYTWGLDMSGNSIDSAGGIGGLLAVQDQKVDIGGGQTALRNYITAYDGNGNVTQLVRRNNGDLDAAYEYDAYGNVVASGGLYADQNAIRFSSKYWDDETGFGYWGYRYYSAGMGRWLNRDPIGTLGGANAYAYNRNYPSAVLDAVGLAPIDPYTAPPGTWDDRGMPFGPRDPAYQEGRRKRARDLAVFMDMFWHWSAGNGSSPYHRSDDFVSDHVKSFKGWRTDAKAQMTNKAFDLLNECKTTDSRYVSGTYAIPRHQMFVNGFFTVYVLNGVQYEIRGNYVVDCCARKVLLFGNRHYLFDTADAEGFKDGILHVAEFAGAWLWQDIFDAELTDDAPFQRFPVQIDWGGGDVLLETCPATRIWGVGWPFDVDPIP